VKEKDHTGLSIRERLEQLEEDKLSPLAMKSRDSRGRLTPEKPCHVRPAFQRDRDRIVHSKAFRRLKHKTQVFLAPKGDHYRTRLTHTIEVSQIARTVAKALFLNEDLTEAIALGHDLGHTPFGHAGEHALDEVHPGGFHHWEQSLRVVDKLASEGRGLNLTHEVRDGILKHSKGRSHPILAANGDDLPQTLEGKIVRVADVIAYTNHDLQDAIAAGLVKPSDLPKDCLEVLGRRTTVRINTMVSDIISATQSLSRNEVAMSSEVLAATTRLRDWLFEAVYFHPDIQAEFTKARHIIHELYHYYCRHPEVLAKHMDKKELTEPVEREACDHIAAMSDSYALHIYEELFLPKPWSFI
jgi:dGTPase